MTMTTADALLQPLLARLPTGSRGGTYRFDCGDSAHVVLPNGHRVTADGDSPGAAVKHLERKLAELGVLIDPWEDAWGA